MTDRTDAAMTAERQVALALGTAIELQAHHHRLKYHVKSAAIGRLLASTNPATNRPFTQVDAGSQTLLDPEYAAWDAEMTRLEIQRMLAETELHVAKQSLEMAVRASDPDGGAAVEIDGRRVDGLEVKLGNVIGNNVELRRFDGDVQPWQLGDEDAP